MKIQLSNKSLHLIVILTIVVAVSGSRQRTQDGQDQPPLPISPLVPNCSSAFPGTPDWNSCWATFHQSMNNFQQQMQEYTQKVAALASKDVPSNLDGDYYSHKATYSSFMGSSHSNVRINGYMIEASGISIGTSTVDHQLRITLMIGNVDAFETKTEGNEVKFQMKIGDQEKWAKVTVPNGINLDEIKVERTPETVVISGPTKKPLEANMMLRRSGNVGSGRGRSLYAPTTSFRRFSDFPEASFETFPQHWYF